jgi:hypothetical protein
VFSVFGNYYSLIIFAKKSHLGEKFGSMMNCSFVHLALHSSIPLVLSILHNDPGHFRGYSIPFLKAKEEAPRSWISNAFLIRKYRI